MFFKPAAGSFRKLPTRTLTSWVIWGIFWLFFCNFIAMSYFSNLRANLVAIDTIKPIDNLQVGFEQNLNNFMHIRKVTLLCRACLTTTSPWSLFLEHHLSTNFSMFLWWSVDVINISLHLICSWYFLKGSLPLPYTKKFLTKGINKRLSHPLEKGGYF